MSRIPAGSETERLRLRPWTADDLDRLTTLFAIPEFWRYPFGRGLDRDATEAFLHRQLRAQDAGEPALWAAELLEGGPVMGFIGLAVPRWLPEVMPAVEVGWRLHPEAWGRGLATEGAAAALRHGFETLGLDRILAMCDPANAASARVMAKLGMRHVENLPVAAFDAVTQVYALTRGEWAEMTV